MKPEPNLAPTNIDELSVFSNPFDVRQDLHAFIEYVQDNEVKRSHRSNELSASDTKRLAKLMSHSFLSLKSPSMNINMMQRTVDMAISMNKRKNGTKGHMFRSMMRMRSNVWKVAMWNDSLKEYPLI